jgi:hypothetical protein
MKPSRRHAIASVLFLAALSWGTAARAFKPLPPQVCEANQPLICNSTNGAILNSPHVYVVYWGWGCTSGATCQTKYSFTTGTNEIWAIEAMLTDRTDYGHNGIGGSRWLNRERQYVGTVVGSTSTTKVGFSNPYGLMKGEWFDDTDPYVDLGSTNPSGPSALTTMLKSAASHFGIQNDPQSLIVVARPPGSQTTDASGCGYHNFILNGSSKLVFADINYQGLINGASCLFECFNGPLCATQTALGHELIEAITDPLTGDPTQPGYRNYADNFGESETGDLCLSAPLHSIALQPDNNEWGPEYKNVSLPQGVNDGIAHGRCAFSRAGHSDVFALGTGSPAHVFRSMQSEELGSPQGGPSLDWGVFGSTGHLMSAPTAVSWAPGRIDAFAWDSSFPSNLVHAYVDSNSPNCPGPGSPCTDSWGPLTADTSWNPLNMDPVVVSWGPGRLDLFAVGCSAASRCTQYSVFQRTWDVGTDTGWVNRGPNSPVGGIAYGVGATTNSIGGIDVFLVSTDYQQILHASYQEQVPYALTGGTFSSWTTWLGPQFLNGQAVNWRTRPAAASWIFGRLDVVLVDLNGGVYDCAGSDKGSQGFCTLLGPPSGVTFLPGKNTGPSVTALGNDRLLFSAIGTDGGLWVQEYDYGQDTGGWTRVALGLGTRSSSASSW